MSCPKRACKFLAIFWLTAHKQNLCEGCLKRDSDAGWRKHPESTNMLWYQQLEINLHCWVVSPQDISMTHQVQPLDRYLWSKISLTLSARENGYVFIVTTSLSCYRDMHLWLKGTFLKICSKFALIIWMIRILFVNTQQISMFTSPEFLNCASKLSLCRKFNHTEL
jgi:hypothetical protein